MDDKRELGSLNCSGAQPAQTVAGSAGIDQPDTSLMKHDPAGGNGNGKMGPQHGSSLAKGTPTGPSRSGSEVEQFIGLVLDELSALSSRSELDAIDRAVELILEREACGGRVHVTGVGKSEYVARYVASLFSSTGTPSYFLHATECVHGSAGQMGKADVAIAISNSGCTPELMSAVEALRELDIKIIGVSGKEDSALVALSDVFLYAGVDNEGGILNLAPRVSILAESLVLCCLSVALESRKGLTREQYARWHPGGVLGRLARGD
jgi:D-arabinose 5-phosphate isomerase GutQ